MQPPNVTPATGATPSVRRFHGALIGTMAVLLIVGSAAASIIGETWAQRYSQPTASSDGPARVITDSEGNVVVAGYTTGFISWADWLVLKYSNEGALLWAQHYSGPGISSEEPYDVAAGVDGRVVADGG